MTALAHDEQAPRLALRRADAGRRSESGRIAAALTRDRAALAGLVIVAAFVAAGVLADVLATHPPNAVDVSRRLEPPSAEFWLGTDHLGRDLWARLLHGARISLGATAVAASGMLAIGTVLGTVAAYAGGGVDFVISRVIDMLLAVPGFLLALAIIGFIGPGLPSIVIAFVAVSWAGYARIMRGAVLAELGKAYVESARATGAPAVRLLRRHVLPNVIAPLVVLTTLDMAGVLLGLAGLSFLGLGVQPPAAEWGSMLSEGRTYLTSGSQMMLFPGLAIFLAALGFNLLGDGLRDALDPRSRTPG